ncbi:12679_t:CDS:2, partial [Racocetra fulgida]
MVKFMTWIQSKEFASYIDANFIAASQTPDYSKDTLISDSDEYLPDDASLCERQSFDTESIFSNSTSTSQVKPLFIDRNDESQFNVPSYKSVRGLFIDEEDCPQYGSFSIPTIKISCDDVDDNGSQHTRNYREELIKLIL